MGIFDTIAKLFTSFTKIIPLLVTLASIATAVIPNPSPEEAATLALIHKVLDIVALNSVGHNAQK